MLNVKKIPTKLRYFILFVGFASVLLKIVWKQLLISPSCNELESSYVSGEFVSGGFYSPTSCIPLNTIAIIVPFRNRGHQQDIFVLQITSFLLRQRCSFQILIVEQFDSLPFNRASLLNAGVVWLENNMKQMSFSCYIFHDVDHVPLDNRNIYECNLTRPVHFSTAVDKWNYSIPYDGFFGGVVAFSPKQFQQINGFSNCFWGWGGEDDDMLRRVEESKMTAGRKSPRIGRYKTLPHESVTPNNARFKILKKEKQTKNRNDTHFSYKNMNFEIISVERNYLFTKISVDLNKTRDNC